MKKRIRRHKDGALKRLEIDLDLLMSGKFRKILKTMMIWSGIIFVVLIIFGILHTWLSGSEWGESGALLPGQLILDLSNPTFSDNHAAWSVSWFVEHILVVITNLFGIILVNGVLLSIVVNWLSSRREQVDRGQARYSHFRKGNFSVIIGGHRMVAHLAKTLMERPENEYVIIQTRGSVQILRKEILAEISDREVANDVTIYAGDRTAWHELEELHLQDANEVFILGEDGYLDGDNHDALNMKCWQLINDNIHERRDAEGKIPCHVMFEFQSTFAAFQNTDLRTETASTFSFIPFSPYESWAQQLIVGDLKVREGKYTPLDGFKGIAYNDPRRVHLIVVGMSKMGVAVALEAARTAHYPNFNNPTLGNPRTLITFIDTAAERESNYLMSRYSTLFDIARWRYIHAPRAHVEKDGEWRIYDTVADINDGANLLYPWHRPLENVAEGSPYCGGYLGDDLVDVDFEFISGNVALPSVRRYISMACEDRQSITTIAVCLPSASEAMSAALYLPDSVYGTMQEMWVQQRETGAMVNAIRNGMTGLDTGRYRRLRAFGMVDRCDYTRVDASLPQFVAYAYHCHDCNTSFLREYNASNCDARAMRNKAVKVWEAISRSGGKSAISQRWSNLYCANTFPSKIRSFGLNPDCRDEVTDTETLRLLAFVEHNRWVVEQLLSGFSPLLPSDAGRTLSREEKAAFKASRRHPDIVSNSKLGDVKKYDIVIARVTTLALSLAKELDNGK